MRKLVPLWVLMGCFIPCYSQTPQIYNYGTPFKFIHNETVSADYDHGHGYLIESSNSSLRLIVYNRESTNTLNISSTDSREKQVSCSIPVEAQTIYRHAMFGNGKLLIIMDHVLDDQGEMKHRGAYLDLLVNLTTCEVSKVEESVDNLRDVVLFPNYDSFEMVTISKPDIEIFDEIAENRTLLRESVTRTGLCADPKLRESSLKCTYDRFSNPTASRKYFIIARINKGAEDITRIRVLNSDFSPSGNDIYTGSIDTHAANHNNFTSCAKYWFKSPTGGIFFHVQCKQMDYNFNVTHSVAFRQGDISEVSVHNLLGGGFLAAYVEELDNSYKLFMAYVDVAGQIVSHYSIPIEFKFDCGRSGVSHISISEKGLNSGEYCFVILDRCFRAYRYCIEL